MRRTAARVRRIAFGKTEIAYRLRRSRRQKTVSIAVDPRAKVVVTSPKGTPASRLDGIVRRKGSWVLARLRAAGRLDGPSPAREFVSGESYFYLGRQYRLKVVPGGTRGRARLVGGWLHVDAGKGARAQPTALLRRAIEAWYRARAQARLPERVALLAARLGVPAPAVLIREQPKRWGSCDARGAIRINWRIMQASMRLVEYVVAHELVHLREKNHTRTFWSRLGRAVPDHDRRREDLRRLGPRLLW